MTFAEDALELIVKVMDHTELLLAEVSVTARRSPESSIGWHRWCVCLQTAWVKRTLLNDTTCDCTVDGLLSTGYVAAACLSYPRLVITFCASDFEGPAGHQVIVE